MSNLDKEFTIKITGRQVATVVAALVNAYEESTEHEDLFRDTHNTIVEQVNKQTKS